MKAIESGLFAQNGALVPLLGVRAEGTVVGRGARMTISQWFRNQEERPLEAVYKFPLPEGAAIVGFWAEVGGKRITGHVDVRDKAFDLYDDALQKGKGGYLLDEERSNIFTLSVGNLNPGTEAVVHIEYVTLLDGDGNDLRLVIPTTITPRYIPENHRDDNDIPLHDRIHPPYAREVPYGLQMRILLEGADAYSAVASPSHPVRIENLENHQTAVSLAQRSVAMDRDMVLTLTLRETSRHQAHVCTDERGAFIQLDLCFQDEDGEAERPDTEETHVFFLVDCSGSMDGNSISEARLALELCLKALVPGTRFNVIRFGSYFESLFLESEPYSESSLQQALDWTGRLRANLGGTEIYKPLEHVYNGWSHSNGKRGAMLLLTDGAVGNEEQILSLARSHSGLRVFPVGIGAGPNESFIKGLARAAKGTFAFVYPGERLEPIILRLFGNLLESGVEVVVEWGSKESDQVPISPAVFTHTPISLFARLAPGKRPPENVTVRAALHGNTLEWNVPVLPATGARAPIPFLWAREKIRELEDGEAWQMKGGSRQIERRQSATTQKILDISRTYGVLSQCTSFVAIEEREGQDRTTGEAVFRKVPVAVTMGWHGLGKTGPLRMAVGPFEPPMAGYEVMSVREDSLHPDAHYCIRRASPPRFNFIFESEEYTAPSGFEWVMAILKMQKAEGGFAVDEELAAKLGVHLPDLVAASQEMCAAGRGWESLALVWAAVVLESLEQHFARFRKDWEKVVKKTKEWLQKVIKQDRPTIGGESLTDWASLYVATHRPPEPRG